MEVVTIHLNMATMVVPSTYTPQLLLLRKVYIQVLKLVEVKVKLKKLK